ncbi:hypothetical protein K439DRAFT_1620760 [Ramaria rubella]|nr:hypothetical protein K439DRAFT_1620760 [Ramaria rubella]
MASIEDSVFDFLAYNYTLTAAFTLMVYDTFITFPDEITFIWKGNFRLAPLFYVMTRYGGILSRGVNIYINNAQFHSAQTEVYSPSYLLYLFPNSDNTFIQSLCSDLGFTMNSLALVVWLGIHGLLIMQTYAICHRNWVVLIWLLLLALGSLVPNILLTVTTTCSTEGQVTHATILVSLLRLSLNAENTIASITELIFDTLIAAVTFYRILKLWNLQKTLEKNSLTQLLLQQGRHLFLTGVFFSVLDSF